MTYLWFRPFFLNIVSHCGLYTNYSGEREGKGRMGVAATGVILPGYVVEGRIPSGGEIWRTFCLGSTGSHFISN